MPFLGGVAGFLIGILLILITAARLGLGVPPILTPLLPILTPAITVIGPMLVPLAGILWIIVSLFTVFIINVFAYALATIGLIPLLTPAPTGLLPANPLEGFMRGLIIGLTAALNLGIWALLGVGSLGLIVGLLCFLAVLGSISINVAYQAALGWASWLMPMSLPATALGAFLFIVNLLFSPLGFPITSLRLDVLTGTIETRGGIVIAVGMGLAPAAFSGFNLGNFAFLSVPPTPFAGPGGISAHETGHTLNVAAFGNVFHWINAVDENVPPFAKGSRAYGELAAESHFPSAPSIRPFIRLWS